ncbi:hypothetical protein ABEF95_008263 [Exophiala dermatitidis]
MASFPDVPPPAMQSFTTATGQPYSPSHNKPGKSGSAMDAMASVESYGAGPANLLPMKFTDDSLISVPVLRPEDVGRHHQVGVASGEGGSPPGGGAETKTMTTGRRSFFRRKSHNSSSSSDNFIMRRIPRREYLAHYAKDEAGRYIGSEEPAKDCILHEDDLVKFRRNHRDGEGAAVGDWKNEISSSSSNPNEPQAVWEEQEQREQEQKQSDDPLFAAGTDSKKRKSRFGKSFFKTPNKREEDAVIH